MRCQKEGKLVHVWASLQAAQEGLDFGHRASKRWIIIGYHSVGEGSDSIYQTYFIY